VAIMAVTGGEMTAGDEAAGAHAELEIEGMADEAIA
jgi:hypothetical protein